MTKTVEELTGQLAFILDGVQPYELGKALAKLKYSERAFQSIENGYKQQHMNDVLEILTKFVTLKRGNKYGSV